MKLGLLADIHESIDALAAALDRFRQERVDCVVVLGDVFDRGTGLVETCRLLEDAEAIGVWGNHDFGLCAAPDKKMLRQYGAKAMNYLSRFQPRLYLGDCHFTHVEPWLDPHEVMDLWYFEGLPDTPEKVDRIFAWGSPRLMFAGHYHQWLLVTPEGIQPWQGESPINLAEGRYFVVLGAARDGHAALLDTETSLLTPLSNLGQ